MEYLIGALLALGVAGLATIVGFYKERAFHLTVLMVVASYYVLFAAMGGGRSLGTEIAVGSGFAAIAILGYKGNFWLVAAGLVAHSVFDSVHARFIHNPGMPPWWPGFCLAYDGIAGAWLALLLMRKKHGLS